MPDKVETGIRRILLVSLDDPTKRGGVGGKHVHIDLLMRGLREDGREVALVTVRENLRFNLIHRYPGAIWRRIIRDKGKRFYHYTNQYVAELRRNLKHVWDEPSVLNPHDVLSCNLANEILGSKAPIVLTLHGYYTMEATSSGEIPRNSAIFNFYIEEEQKACDDAHRIICVDNRIRNYLVSKLNVSTRKISVLPNAIDTKTFTPISPVNMRARRNLLGIPGERFIALCPRRLVPKNGVKYATLAFLHLRRRVPDALLIIAGDGPEATEIERIIKGERLQDSVILKGNIPHRRIVEFYQACDAVIIPSITSEGVEEATSLSMLEGMACGKPVIVTNIGGLIETVRHNETGIIVNQADPEAIAMELERLYREPEIADKIGSLARRYVEQNHSYTVHARRMIAEYERTLIDGGR